MSAGSCGKHLRGHREFAKLCRDRGCPTARCVHGKLPPNALPGLHLVLRRTERLRLDAALAEAASQAGHDLPMVAHRSNGQPWRVTMELDAFFRLYEAFRETAPPGPASPESGSCPNSAPAPGRLPAGPAAP